MRDSNTRLVLYRGGCRFGESEYGISAWKRLDQEIGYIWLRWLSCTNKHVSLYITEFSMLLPTHVLACCIRRSKGCPADTCNPHSLEVESLDCRFVCARDKRGAVDTAEGLSDRLSI